MAITIDTVSKREKIHLPCFIRFNKKYSVFYDLFQPKELCNTLASVIQKRIHERMTFMMTIHEYRYGSLSARS